MSNDNMQVRLEPHVMEMAALEGQVDMTLSRLAEISEGPTAAIEAISAFHAMVQGHQTALQAHRQLMRSTSEDSGGHANVPLPTGAYPGGTSRSLPTEFHRIYSTFAYAAIGYAMLHARAHRFYDIPTADLAESHLRDYFRTMQAIGQLISETAVWEFEKHGQECQCHCPSCGLGVCVCVPHGSDAVAEAWHETRPDVGGKGVFVRRPRRSSEAARVGLREGDIVTAVDDEEVGSYGDQQKAIRKHAPGEEIRLRVRRGIDDLESRVQRPTPPV